MLFQNHIMRMKKNKKNNLKKIIIITGGAGFVGSNLISLFLKKTNFKIISIDNYSTGTRKNHVKNKKYFKNTKKI